MLPFRLFAATGDAVACLDSVDGASVQTSIVLGNEHQSHEGHIVNGVMCIAVDPHDPEWIFAGTFDRGIYRGRDSLRRRGKQSRPASSGQMDCSRSA